MQENYPEIDHQELKSKIDDVKIKNIIKKQMVTKCRNLISNYTRVYIMQSLVFLNQILCMMLSQLLFFLRNVHCLIKVKIRLNHSHITGKFLGYTHDFCNWTVRENK